MLDCYRNFRDDEVNEDEVPVSNSREQPTLVMEIDLMYPSGAPPLVDGNGNGGVPIYPLTSEEVPAPISVEPSVWNSFAASVADQSNQLLFHRSKELAFLYFGVLVLFIVVLTAVKYYVDSYVIEAILIGLCLASILVFAIGFNRLPVWHDGSLDDKILEIVTRQPLPGYTLMYVRFNHAEDLMGVTRRIRIYEPKGTYRQPNLESI
jgi:hypothetical protein